MDFGSANARRLAGLVPPARPVSPRLFTAGYVVFFDCYVPHSLPANSIDKARRNVCLAFNRKVDGDWRMACYEETRKNYPPNRHDAAGNRANLRG